MTDYKDKLDEWQRAARRKARELDEKYDIKGRVEEGARLAQDAAKRGREAIAREAERARTEAERLGDDFEVRERARHAAEEAARRAREASEVARETARHAAQTAGEKANEAFKGAKNYYERASVAFDRGARFTRASATATRGLYKAGNWIKHNPGKTGVILFSMSTGIHLGRVFPGLDAVLLGSHPHWLTHSALPVYGLRKASEKFDLYLRSQEQLIADGQLSEAERQRVEFERKIVRYVGAPLLGTFSCAAGLTMWAQIFQPGRITGAPISWLLGGNPILDDIWLFANGVICFQQGYKFFMMAVADQEEVKRVVREIKGLLPAGEAA
ncbi:MAG TPA: hypothetical protein VF544_14530 [Pyrinomonadaceae bacterium]|jgi:hypothetical protein